MKAKKGDIIHHYHELKNQDLMLVDHVWPDGDISAYIISLSDDDQFEKLLETGWITSAVWYIPAGDRYEIIERA